MGAPIVLALFGKNGRDPGGGVFARH